MLRPRVVKANTSGLARGFEDEVAGYVTAAMEDTAVDVQNAFRDQVRAAGLGERLANAIRHKVYPNRGGVKALDPVGWVYARPGKDSGRGAAAIIESYADGAMIVPRNGHRFLAIPSSDCPRKRQGQALSPEEVEAKFGRKLQFIAAGDKGFHSPSSRHSAIGYLVLKGLVVRKSSGAWRNSSANEKAGRTRNPRPLQSVIMFELVRWVKKPKSVDLDAPAAIADERLQANLNHRWR